MAILILMQEEIKKLIVTQFLIIYMIKGSFSMYYELLYYSLMVFCIEIKAAHPALKTKSDMNPKNNE